MIHRCYCVVVAISAYFVLAAQAQLKAADWPTEVVARYDISFAGFHVGTFDFRSSVNSQQYSLAGEANISAVFGAFEWMGRTRSYGIAGSKKPNPKDYAFDYHSNADKGSVRIAFMRGHIIRSDVSPYKPYTNQYIPLRREHMRNVYDPISAVMALTRSASDDPCQQKLPIFDGKQRFDLVLSPMGRKQIREEGPSGLPELAYVCKVQYVPIGGYKPDSQTDYMVKNQGMRIVLRAVPSAKLFIPYEVRIPTIAGEALLSSRKVNILTAQRQRIALVH